MPPPRLLYEIRADVLVSAHAAPAAAPAAAAPPPATLRDVPDSFFASLRARGVDVLHVLGAFERSALGLEHAVAQLPPAAPRELACASPFCIADYVCAASLGGDAALRALRARANAHGIAVVLDFVANHVARDHHWLREHPALIERAPSAAAAIAARGRFFAGPVDSAGGEAPFFAYGSDAAGNVFCDTAQVSLRSPSARAALLNTMLYLAHSGVCDGLRCDLVAHEWAMPEGGGDGCGAAAVAAPVLAASGPAAAGVLADALAQLGATAYTRALGALATSADFFPAACACVKALSPHFILLSSGAARGGTDAAFDAVYDRGLAYALSAGAGAEAVLLQLRASSLLGARRCTFNESHEVPRCAGLGERSAQAAATIALLAAAPSRCVNDGQLSGRALQHSVLCGPRPAEAASASMLAFYVVLLGLVRTEEALRSGVFHVALATPLDGSGTWRSIVAFFVTASPARRGPAARPTQLPASSPTQLPPALVTHESSLSAGSASTAGGSIAADFKALRPAAPAPAPADAAAAVAASSDASSPAASPPAASPPAASPPAASPPAASPPAAVVVAPAPASAHAAPAAAAAAPAFAPAAPAAALDDAPADTFLVVVNLSGAPAGGRVLFSRADDSAYLSEATAASAARVAALAAPGAGVVLFVERLRGAAPPQLATAASLGAEGLAVELAAWEARALQCAALGAALVHSM
jgi:hypothetical protein